MEEMIIRTEYSELMRKSYIDYAMSVIVSRAIPDVRDGLKPVQRRTLYDMRELGTHHDKPYRKCARIVGDTMGKYHPHGDSSIYDALVVMAQEFKKGRVLVDGHGNFGSIEGDEAAAMRYTEARLEKFTEDVFLKDLNLDIVDFVPNFDETDKEPEVLPVRIPNILLNGSEGIAVGMTTNIPPHNLAELTEAVIAYLGDPELTTRELMKYIKGPDFPTGGIVVNKDDLPEIYESGHGRIKIRGRVETEKGKGGKLALVITEIPYTMIGSGIGKFLNDVAELVETKKAPEIIDISNQSSKDGIRIVLELRKGSDPERLKNLLYSKTRLEDVFGVNMLAVVNNRPETCSLRRLIEQHVDFRIELENKKYRKLLSAQIEKQEITEGLIKACDMIDLIIEVIRGSKSQKQVKDCLTMGITEGINFKKQTSKKAASKFCFTLRQAEAILDMRLYKLIGLEIMQLQKDYDEILKNIARYEDILANYDSMKAVIIDDLTAMRNEFGTARKTEITNAVTETVANEAPVIYPVTVLCDRFGYIKGIDPATYEKNKESADKQARFVISTRSDERICVFSDKGNLHTIRVDRIPFGKLKDKGVPIDNLSSYSSAKESVIFIDSIENIKKGQMVFVTSDGLIKLTDGTEFDTARKLSSAAKLSSDDERLVFAGNVSAFDYLVMESSGGYFLKMTLKEIPTKKKTALGVRGMKLAEGEYISGAYLLAGRTECVIEYAGKELCLNKLKLGKRDTRGTKIRI